jgi:hypothetical protein
VIYLITENEKRQIMVFDLKSFDGFSSHRRSGQPFAPSEFDTHLKMTLQHQSDFWTIINELYQFDYQNLKYIKIDITIYNDENESSFNYAGCSLRSFSIDSNEIELSSDYMNYSDSDSDRFKMFRRNNRLKSIGI